MARCGCNNTCNCLVLPVDTPCINMSVSGLGTPISPYKVSAVPIIDPDPNNTLTCGPAGLLAQGVMILPQDTDSIDMHVVEAPNNTFTISADVLLQDDGTGPLAGTPNGSINLLKLNPGQGINGLYVSCEDIQDCVGAEIGPAIAGTCLTYNDASNEIDVQIAPDVADPGAAVGNGIECGTNGLLVAPSADAGNTITYGADGRLYAAGAVVQGDVDNDNCVNTSVTGTGTAVDPYILESSLIIDPNGCNAASCSGAGLLIPKVTLTTQTLKPGPGCIDVIETPGCPDNWLIRLGISADADNILQCRGDGLFVCGTEQATAFSAIGATGPQGPFNGTFNNSVVGATICATITNPSNCKPMTVKVTPQASVGVFAAGGTGDFLAGADVSFNGGASFFASGMGLGIGNVSGGAAQTQGVTGTISDTGLTLVVPPGGTATACMRPTVTGQGAVNGRVKQISYNLQLIGTAI